MRNIIMLFLLCFFLEVDCAYCQKTVEVGYVFRDLLVGTEFIMMNSETVPITFDAASNPEALARLYNLKPSILYANNDGTTIFLTGEYHRDKHTFTLKNWFIKTPFKQYRGRDEPGASRQGGVIERMSLETSDFYDMDLLCRTSIEVGYVFHESTAWTRFILLNSHQVPIRFNPTSNPEALASLRHLKPLIVYANCDGTQMFLKGCYNITTQMFTLERWYIKSPFKEYRVKDETILPHTIEVVERTSLEVNDFYKTETFDPNHETFDPDRYTEKNKKNP